MTREDIKKLWYQYSIQNKDSTNNRIIDFNNFVFLINELTEAKRGQNEPLVTKSEQPKGDLANGAVAEKKIVTKDDFIYAWRMLYYNNLLTDKEKDNIAKKINKKFS